MIAGFLQLQGLLVVAIAASSFVGGGEACFGEDEHWARWYGMEADSKRFVAKGRDGMCLAVYGGRGVDFATAENACNVSFVGGRLLSNDSWGAFVKARDNSKVLTEFNKTIYVGFSPEPGLGCFVIAEFPKVILEDPCRMEQRGFVCEYPRNEVCRWEWIRGETPIRGPYGRWELPKEVVLLQEVDGSEKSCKPDDAATPISDRLGACRPLFNDTWSEWSECGSCGNQRLQSYQQRYQVVTDRCEQLAGFISRHHIKTCFQMPCSTDATTQGGVSVISISHLPILFVFLSMFSH